MGVIFQMPQEALNLLIAEKSYWALFYMPLYAFLHNLLTVLVEIANRMRLQKKLFVVPMKTVISRSLNQRIA
jgi:hypothetical protein